MKRADFRKSLDVLHERLCDLTATKGEEYRGVGEESQFGNFERHAKRLGMTREQILSVYLGKHMDAIDTFIKDHAAGVDRSYSEPITGRIDDAILYLTLLRGMVSENEHAPFKDSIIEAPINFKGVFKTGTAAGGGTGGQSAAVATGGNGVQAAQLALPNGWTSFQRRLDSTINQANDPLDVAVLLLVPAATSETMEVCRYRKIPIGVNVITSVDQLRGFRGGSVIFVHYQSDSQNTAAYNAAESAYREAIDLLLGRADCSMYLVSYE